MCGPSGQRRAHRLRAPRSAAGCGASFSHRGPCCAPHLPPPYTGVPPRAGAGVRRVPRDSGQCSADVHALLRETATAAAAREWRESGASSHETRRELPTFPSSAAAGAAPSRSPVLASGCHGRSSRGVTVTITTRPTPGAWPRASTLATPHAWLRSSLPSSVLGGAPAGQRRH